jgi:hypothetical protein
MVTSFGWHLRLQYILNTEGFQTFLQCSRAKSTGKSLKGIITVKSFYKKGKMKTLTGVSICSGFRQGIHHTLPDALDFFGP